MDAAREPTFLHLNRDGRWPDFRWTGLELELDGTLHLIPLPRLVDGTTAKLATLPVPSAPGGIAVTADGRVFWSDPNRGLLIARDPCDGKVAALPCLGAGAPFREPRGLAVHPRRGTVMVADAGAGRIWLLSADARAVAEWWEVPSEDQAPRPWSIAVLDDHVYVLDVAARRIHKLDVQGLPVPGFAEAIDASAVIGQPSAIAARDGHVFVLDPVQRVVVIFDEDGSLVRSFPLTGVQEPMGLAVGERAVFVGDNGARAIVQFGPDGGRVGQAIGYAGPVAALALGDAGDLWVSPGSGAAPHRLAARGGYVRQGIVWGGPFGFADTAHAWGRLSALGPPRAEAAHLRFLIHLADDTETPPAPAPGQDVSPWRAGPPDVADLYVGGTSRYLWVGAVFEGDGSASPHVAQMRVEADHETYSRYLPPFYIRDPEQKETLDRFLSLFESQYEDARRTIADLPRLFDPATAPEHGLAWLAGWLGVSLEEAWPEEKKRQAIARAFATHRWRGTAQALQDALEFEVGIRAVVEEPIVHGEWWALPRAEAEDTAWHETSVLGFTTMLTAGPPEGAVLGTTATLDHARIISDADFGAPLFDELAHRFTVRLYRPAASDPRLVERVRDILEREKPAHTTYEVCVVEPTMRVQYQAIVGVETVVAGGPPPATALGQPAAQPGVVLAGEPPGRIGAGAVIGKSSHLGEGVLDAD